MPIPEVIVIGGSAGGLEPLKDLVAALPAEIPAAVLVVVHLSPYADSRLPAILARAGTLPANFPADRSPLQRGVISVAPPNHHLWLDDGRVRVTGGARENGHRPAIDVLFRTAAKAYGARVAGILLSGALDDGVAGMRAIRESGGVTIAQSPEDADFPEMPAAAIDRDAVDYVIPLPMIPRVVLRLMRMNDGSEAGPPQREPAPGHHVGEPLPAPPAPDASGPPTSFVCPACGGSLWEVSESGMLRYRCHVGHGFSPEALAAGNGDQAEQAMWTAVRVLRDRARLTRELAERAGGTGNTAVADRFATESREAERAAETLRQLLSR